MEHAGLHAGRQDRARSPPRSKPMRRSTSGAGRSLRGEAANADAMGQFGKLTSLDDLPPTRNSTALIREAAELATSAPAPRKTKHAPKPPPKCIPNSPPRWPKRPRPRPRSTASRRRAQRDYLEWIAEAKQDATRAQAHRHRRSNG